MIFDYRSNRRTNMYLLMLTTLKMSININIWNGTEKSVMFAL